MTSIVAERLCGSIPMTTRSEMPLTASSDARSTWFVEPGGQRYFEPSKPLLSLSPPWGDARAAQAKWSHTTSVGSRNESDNPSASTEAWPGRATVAGQ